MNSTIEQRKRLLKEEIETARFNLQENIQDIELHEYLLHQFKSIQTVARFVPTVKSTSTHLIDKYVLNNGPLINWITRIIKLIA